MLSFIPYKGSRHHRQCPKRARGWCSHRRRFYGPGRALVGGGAPSAVFPAHPTIGALMVLSILPPKGLPERLPEALNPDAVLRTKPFQVYCAT